MDPFSHRLANALVGNSGETATLEVTLSGPALEFESNCVIAIAGAEFVVTVDGEVAPHAQAFAVASRSKVEFATRLRGARAYLAVDGGFEVPLTLGSRATHVASHLGGLEGRPLRKGDRFQQIAWDDAKRRAVATLAASPYAAAQTVVSPSVTVTTPEKSVSAATASIAAARSSVIAAR